ncbi:hypothetical protein STEG23_029800, partial [Scotinomys teguina]
MMLRPMCLRERVGKGTAYLMLDRKQRGDTGRGQDNLWPPRTCPIVTCFFQETVRPILLDPHLVSSPLHLQHVTQCTGFSKRCWLDERTDEERKEVAESRHLHCNYKIKNKDCRSGKLEDREAFTTWLNVR